MERRVRIKPRRHRSNVETFETNRQIRNACAGLDGRNSQVTRGANPDEVAGLTTLLLDPDISGREAKLVNQEKRDIENGI